MARSRTTKALAKRIELDYFHRPHPLRTWKGRISGGALALTILAVGWALLPSQRIAWSGGDLSAPHAIFQRTCGACHGFGPASLYARPLREAQAGAASLPGALGGGMGAVTDAACSACHAGPVHHTNQLTAPACATCHLEHRGHSPVTVEDSHCLFCHRDLKTRGGAPGKTERKVVSFPGGHPQFDAVAAGRDPGRLRLNHRLHLKLGLRGPRGPTTLACRSCHSLDDSGLRMRPVNYKDFCATCHLLTFDTEGRFPPDTAVPHGDSEAARVFLVDLYAGSAVRDPAASARTDPVARALALQRSRQARAESPAYVPLSLPAGSDRAYVVERVALALTVLQRQTCAFCHGPGQGKPLPGAAPPPAGRSLFPPPLEIPKPAVPTAWMPAASFSHRAHRTLACSACHPTASTSERTSDVLLPGKRECAACHRPDAGAPSTCVTCHRYHPPETDPLVPSRFSLPRTARPRT